MIMHTEPTLGQTVLFLAATVSFLSAAVKGSCSNPPTVDHAEHDGGSATSFAEDHMLTYSCEYGYNKDGNGRAICHGGSWTGPTMECTAKSCGDPGTPLHGSRDSEVFSFGSDMLFTCDDGYTLSGRAWIVCQADGTWSHSAPSCNAVQCPQMSVPAHGSIFPSSQRDYGTVVTVSCDSGHELTGTSQRTCESNGVWSGEDGVCNEVGCTLPYLQDGTIEGSNVQIGDVIYFWCYDNTTREGAFTSVCQDTETWSAPTPKCWRKCVAPAIANGIPVLPTGESALSGVGMILNGTQLFFQCEAGYTLDNKDPARCNNGTLGHVSKCVMDAPPTTASSSAATTKTPSPSQGSDYPTDRPSTKPRPGDGSTDMLPDGSTTVGPHLGGTIPWPMWLIIVVSFVGGLLGVLCMGLLAACLCRKCRDDDKEDPEKPPVKYSSQDEDQILLEGASPPSINYRAKYCHFYMENGTVPVLLCAHPEPDGRRIRCVAVAKKSAPDELTDSYIWYEHTETGTLRSALNNLCLDAAEDATFMKPYEPGKKTQQWSCAYNTIQNRNNSDWVIALPSRDSKSKRVHATKFTSKTRSKWIAYKTGPQPSPRECPKAKRLSGHVAASDAERSHLNSPTSDDSDSETKV